MLIRQAYAPYAGIKISPLPSYSNKMNNYETRSLVDLLNVEAEAKRRGREKEEVRREAHLSVHGFPVNNSQMPGFRNAHSMSQNLQNVMGVHIL